jgi:pimeloyl-ACP methyl ester carboxylesterase
LGRKRNEPLGYIQAADRINVINIMTEKNGPWRKMTGQIRCPVLLMTGDNQLGALVNPEIAAEFAGTCNNTRINIIPGAGHNIRRNQFDAYIYGVKGFLDNCSFNKQA